MHTRGPLPSLSPSPRSLARALSPSSTFERVAHSTLNQFRRSPAAARIAHQADTVTDAAARTLPPPAADPWGEEGGEDGPSTSSSSSLGGRHRRRAALRLVGWGDSPRHDHTAGGRYGFGAGGGGLGKRRNSLEDEDGAMSYVALHRPAGRRVPPWWAAAWRAVAGRVTAWWAGRTAAAGATAQGEDVAKSGGRPGARPLSA